MRQKSLLFHAASDEMQVRVSYVRAMCDMVVKVVIVQKRHAQIE